jgi:phosphotriesterase-related protein
MTTIQTVKGPIDINTMGDTMMHEHVFFQHDKHLREKSINFSLEKLQNLVKVGGRTLVDVGPDPRRNIDWYEEINEKVNLNIIVSTGLYLQRKTPQEFHQMRLVDMQERFLKELTEGIGDSRIRAGVIKVAGDKAQLTPWEIRVMQAAAYVQKETGVPICTHACEGARSQFEVLVHAGADPERTYYSHVEAKFGWEGRSLRQELEYLLGIVREGGSLFFNNFTFEFDTPHEDTMYLMHTICDKGYANRVLFGIDMNYTIDEDGTIWLEAQKAHPEVIVREFAYTYTGAIPLMRKWGFTDEDFKTFLVDNPKRMFSTTRI